MSNLQYAITMIPDSGRFQGIRLAIMSNYATLAVFPSYAAANEYAQHAFGDLRNQFCVKIEPATKCERLIANVVEYFSGRQRIVEGGFQVVNERRPTYEQLKTRLELERESRQRLDAYFAERLRLKERRRLGTVVKKVR